MLNLIKLTFLKLVKVPLDSIPFFYCISCTSQLIVISKLAKSSLNPTLHFIDKDDEEHQSQDEPLVDTICHQPLPEHTFTDLSSLSVTILPILSTD